MAKTDTKADPEVAAHQALAHVLDQAKAARESIPDGDGREHDFVKGARSTLAHIANLCDAELAKVPEPAQEG